MLCAVPTQWVSLSAQIALLMDHTPEPMCRYPELSRCCYVAFSGNAPWRTTHLPLRCGRAMVGVKPTMAVQPYALQATICTHMHG